MLEKILRPVKSAKADVKSSGATTNGTQSTKSAQPTKLVPKNVFKVEESKMEIGPTVEEASNEDMCQFDHFSDDIDFSAVESGENNPQQTLEEITRMESKVLPVAKKSESTDVKLKTAVKSADIFENIRPHWDNAFNMEDDDDADLISAVTDEVMSVDEKQVRLFNRLMFFMDATYLSFPSRVESLICYN